MPRQDTKGFLTISTKAKADLGLASPNNPPHRYRPKSLGNSSNDSAGT